MERTTILDNEDRGPDRSSTDLTAQETRLAAEEYPDRRLLRLAIRMLLVGIVVLTTIRVFVLEPYSIPTGSMKPTIQEGDVILVNKLPYTIRSLRYIPFTQIQIPYLEIPGVGNLQRGDVIVFDYPGPERLPPSDRQFVKRCVAIPGDTIELVDGRIRVNGTEVPSVGGERSADGSTPRRDPVSVGRAYRLLRDGRQVIVPYRGYEIPMDSATVELWGPLIESEGVSVEYRNHIVFVGGLPATRYIVRRNYCFALGDNSADSYDSRYFGFIPFGNLIGRAWIIYWSRKPEGGLRWGRIGTSVR
jgi:signal peptidase I